MNSHWSTPNDIIRDAALQFAMDKWEGQKYRPEVWVEKEALAGIVAKVCRKLDVPYLSCRGYTSQSEMWASGQRLSNHAAEGAIPIIIHLGDHDPSGIDMTRDIEDRLDMFLGYDGFSLDVNRIALNMDQVQQYKPPPNPAKVTDSRFKVYMRKFGVSSWELDALDPEVLAKLIEDAVLSYCDVDLWNAQFALESIQKGRLEELAKNYK
jgi:hypothetical protein